jgi:hypothetical protein
MPMPEFLNIIPRCTVSVLYSNNGDFGLIIYYLLFRDLGFSMELNNDDILVQTTPPQTIAHI